MFVSRANRYKRQAKIARGEVDTPYEMVSDAELFQRMGYNPIQVN